MAGRVISGQTLTEVDRNPYEERIFKPPKRQGVCWKIDSGKPWKVKFCVYARKCRESMKKAQILQVRAPTYEKDGIIKSPGY